jgi:hypothetical protein
MRISAGTPTMTEKPVAARTSAVGTAVTTETLAIAGILGTSTAGVGMPVTAESITTAGIQGAANGSNKHRPPQSPQQQQRRKD